MKSEARSIDSFSGIVAGGHFEITVAVGKPARIVITTDDNILPLVTSKVEKGTLELSTPDHLELAAPIKVDVYVEKLDSFVFGGSGTCIIRDVNSENLTLSVNGSGSIAIAGQATRGDFSISGSGEIEATRLKLIDARTAITGSGNIAVSPTGDLDATITGSGTITLSSKPKSIAEKITGSGSIVRAGG